MAFFKKYGFIIGCLHLLSMFQRGFSMAISTLVFKVKLGLYGCRYGSGMTIDGRVLISSKTRGGLSIGKNFKLNSATASNLVGITNPAIFQLVNGGRITIGDHCGFTSTVFSSRREITVGNHVKIGANVRIFDHDYHALNAAHRRISLDDSLNCKSAPVIIEDDVFIGTNAMILKGVHIGARSVIGAGSVVTLRHIPADSVVAGNPAVILKKGPAGESNGA